VRTPFLLIRHRDRPKKLPSGEPYLQGEVLKAGPALQLNIGSRRGA
jgi:hypothetical protein